MHSAAFDYQPRTRIVFGNDALERVGLLAHDFGASRVLLVTDPGIAAAGHPARALSILEAAGVQGTIFDQVRENPSTDDVDACVAAARGSGADFLIGLGGGSSMDTAKGCNFILTNGGQMQDYWGIGKATKPMLPLIAIPTTAGTGSECQSFALISDAITHQKMACGDAKAAARVAIPRSTPHPVATPARDCLHWDRRARACLETAVTKKRTPLSAMFSREAFRLCLAGLERVLTRPEDLEARGQMLSGGARRHGDRELHVGGGARGRQSFDGQVRCRTWAGGRRDAPAVIRFNAADESVKALYLEHAATAGIGSIDELIERVEHLLALAKLRDVPQLNGSVSAALPELAFHACATVDRKFQSATDRRGGF
jgi:alcohol dehydrogenase